ncbi:hypothetical protein ACFVBP_28460 [Nocardioides sp. NPDC057764]|uniref:hypothetical protein n=1 Tax=Nocardioides sp. NPDC057764 TaxID=3346243 RepID=UPI00366B228E
MSKMVDRLSKILNQAERAEEGSPEHEAFMARAIQLSQAYSIDLAVARAHQASKEKAEEPEERKYQIGQPGQNRLKYLTELFFAVAEANDLKCLVSKSGVYVWATGFPSDHEVAERIYALLSVQMVTEADTALKRGAHKTHQRVRKTQRVQIPEDERAWGEWDAKARRWYAYQEEAEAGEQYDDDRGIYGDPHLPPTHRTEAIVDENGAWVYETKLLATVDGRIWRANFYDGFISRTRSRLTAARKQALRQAGIDLEDTDSPKALALASKTQRVEEAFEQQLVLATGTYQGARTQQADWTAHAAGQDAAAVARLGDEKDLGHRPTETDPDTEGV